MRQRGWAVDIGDEYDGDGDPSMKPGVEVVCGGQRQLTARGTVGRGRQHRRRAVIEGELVKTELQKPDWRPTRPQAKDGRRGRQDRRGTDGLQGRGATAAAAATERAEDVGQLRDVS